MSLPARPGPASRRAPVPGSPARYASLHRCSLKLLCKGGGGAVEARLGVVEELDRNAFHAPFEPALGDVTISEAAGGEAVLEAVAEPAGDDDRVGPVDQGEVASD